MTFVWLALASVFAWFISMLAGGGSSLVLIPIVGLLVGPAAIPPIITISGILGNTERLFAYWRHIDWKIVWWDLPGAILGAFLGAFTLSRLKVEWIGILVGLFLIASAASYFIKQENNPFAVKAWYFLPAGLIYAFLSGLVGSMGPLLVPFYINYGLQKEELLATQAVNRVVIHGIKIVAYTFLGALTLPHLKYGVLLGLAAFPGNWLGHLVLQRMSEQTFRRIVISFVFCSGVYLLWQQKSFIF